MNILNSNLFVYTPETTTDELLDRDRLEERRCEVQRNMRCVGKAIRVMVFLAAFAVVGLGYSTVLIPDWPQTMRQFFMYWPVKAHCALGFASLGCAFVFSTMGLLYRRELNSIDLTSALESRVIPLVPANVIEGPFAPDSMKKVA